MLIENDINSERLVLKTLDESNVNSTYLSWMNDKEVLQYLEVKYSPPKSVSELVNFVKKTNLDDKTLLLGIFLKKNNIHIGNIKLGPISSYHKRASIGFIIGDRNYWRQGLASEAISAVTGYAFTEMGLQKLTAGCYDENVGSAKSLLNAGFVQEATLSSHVVLEGKRLDLFLFARVCEQ